MPRAEPVRAVRGVRDILPAERAAWRAVEAAAGRVAESFGYQEIETPILEHAEVAERVGGDTDVVQKEMYRLQDRGGRWLVLRPEATAGVVRAYFEGGLSQLPQPARLFTVGSMFRYDRPQAGRYRQFHQFNVEAIGDDSAAVDAEVIELAWTWLRQVGLGGVSLEINSIGDASCRPGYLDALREYYRPLRDRLHPDCQRRLESNPLRLLDCKDEVCAPFKAAAPRIADHLCDDCRLAFDRVQSLLDAAGIPYAVNPYLVRGLDYYTRTVFELLHSSLGGAQNALGGGGRYDGLAAALGFPATPAVGFAAGLERVIATSAGEGESFIAAPAADVLVLPDGEGLEAAAAEVARRARQAVPAAVDHSARSLKAKLRSANKLGPRYVALMNAEEASRRVVRLKDMADGEQVEVPWDDLAEALA